MCATTCTGTDLDSFLRRKDRPRSSSIATILILSPTLDSSTISFVKMRNVLFMASSIILIARHFSAVTALIPKDQFVFARGPVSHTACRSTKRLFATSPRTPIIQDEQIELSSGVSMQVLSCQSSSSSKSNNQKKLTPLIFLHGSFHAAWCWAEHYLPYFATLGYPAAALSWRGTGGTFAGEGVKKVKIEEHVSDLHAFLNEFVPQWMEKSDSKNKLINKPVLISHSFGGLSIMKLLELYPETMNEISGAIIMCSVPPSGNGKMTMRFLRRSLRDSWKITAGLAMKKCITNPKLCRELFFGGEDDDYGISDDDIVRFQSYFERDTVATIDLMGLAKQLPSVQTDENGRALFLKPSSSSSTTSSSSPVFLVIGATEDFIVDQEGNEETATYFGTESPIVVDSPHDVMLGKNWKNAANVIHNWLQDNQQ